MKLVTQLYRTINLVSLDIVIGAMICALFFAKIFDVQLLPYALAALGLSVWIIYTTDHLLDAKFLSAPASTMRHRFHQQHFTTLLTVTLTAVAIDVLILIFVRSEVLKVGIVLGMVVVGYLMAQKYLKFLKEFSGAMLYTMGILLPSITVAQSEWSITHMVLLFQFFMTAFINLLLFSWFDRENDSIDKQVSFVLFFGEHVTRLFLLMLFIVQMMLSVLQIVVLDAGITGYIILAMNAVLFIIMAMASFFGKHDRYRIVGDCIFIIPLIYLLQ